MAFTVLHLRMLESEKRVQSVIAVEKIPIRWPCPAVLWRASTIFVLIAVLYADIVAHWVLHWWTDDSYSHGLLVAPLSFWLAWSRWREAPVGRSPDNRGLYLVGFACLMCLMGKLGVEMFLSRLSLVILFAGLLWTFAGFAALRRLSFPLLLLASVVPPPVIVYNNISAPLQLLASSAAVNVVQRIGISVYRDGNIIQLANTSLGVAEACSGLRSLASLTVAALLLGYLDCARQRTRIALLLASVPIAVFFNILRVTGTAILAEYDPELATGFYHAGTGWVVFVAGFGMLWGCAWILRRLLERTGETSA